MIAVEIVGAVIGILVFLGSLIAVWVNLNVKISSQGQQITYLENSVKGVKEGKKELRADIEKKLDELNELIESNHKILINALLEAGLIKKL